MKERSKSYGKARLMTWLSYIAIALSIISFEIEHIKAGINLTVKIPEWIIFILWNFSLAGIFLLLKDYIQEFYQKKLTLLTVSGLIYLTIGPLDVIAESLSIDGLMILSIVLTLVLPILFLISGIQVLETGKKRITGTLLITYALILIVSVILSFYFSLKDEFPLWFYIVGTLVDIIFLTFLSIRFRKISRTIKQSGNTTQNV